MITPSAAADAIAAHLTPFAIESLPLSQCVGATLRENIYAERDNPPFDRVCMDGIAVNSATLDAGERRLRLQGIQAAGSPPLRLEPGATAIEVMTGAMLPRAADCVIPLEEYSVESGIISLPNELRAPVFRNIEPRGADSARGSLMLCDGTLLSAPEIDVAASAGMPRLRVSSQPAFMVVSTGDELIDPGEPIAEHQIRRSNSYAIAAALRARGFDRIGDDHLQDDVEILRKRLTSHLKTHNVLILSGGVSMGKFDHVPQVLRQIGVREIFHKVAQRPGKPLWFGVGPDGQAVFGLPGNPVSVLVCVLRYVIPAVAAAMGTASAPRARLCLAAPVEFKLPLTYFLPVRIQRDESGQAWAEPHATNTSGDFLSLTGTDGIVELPPGPAIHPQGFAAEFYPW